MCVKKRGILNRRDTGMKFKISRHKLHYENAIDNISRIFEAEDYREQTIKGYRRHWNKFSEMIGKIMIS